MSRFFVAFLALSVGCTTETGITDERPEFIEPTLTLDDPSGGAWLPAGEVTVHGTAHALNDIQVNGIAADQDGSHFSAALNLERGVNVLQVSGSDLRGDSRHIEEAVLAGNFADPGLVVEDAVKLRLNRAGIDFVMDEVGGLVKADEIAGKISAVNPVYADSYGVFGWDAVTVRADIGWLWFDQVKLDATPTPGILAVTIDVPNLDVWVPVGGDVIGWDFDVDVWLAAETAEITAAVALSTDGAGNLVVNLVDADVRLYGFSYDTSLLPGEIESYLLVDTVRSTLEDKLTEEVMAQVTPLLEAQLAALDLSFETEMLGKTIAIEAGFSDAAIDPDGLRLNADVNVNVPGDTTYAYAGYLKADSDRLAFPSHTADVALGLSDDLLNRVLFEAWRGGLLEMTLSTEDGSLQPTMLLPLGVDSGTITVSATLPPVIVQNDGMLQAQLGELLVTLDAPGSKLGDHVALAVSLFADLHVGVHNAKLSLELGETDVHIIVRDNEWAGIGNEELTALISDLLPIASLLGLANLEVPLPELAGISIQDAKANRDHSGVHTLVDIDLR